MAIRSFRWVKVWHNNMRMDELHLITFDTHQEQLALAVMSWPQEFIHVATIKPRVMRRGVVKDALDIAWDMTNTIDYHWSDPRNFPALHRTYKLEVHVPDARSSMVGDFIETSGEHLFVIASAGFVEVPHPAMVARIPKDELPLRLHSNYILDRMIEKRLKEV